MLLSTSAFATQSRLLALGLKELDNEGSYYIQDSRNIFLNSANVNNYADLVVLEYGAAGRLLSSNNNSIEQYDQPKAQGGVFRKVGDYVIGAYYGNESNTSSLIRIASSSAAAISFPGVTANGPSAPKMLGTSDNQIDLFFAGQASDIKWGTNLLFAKSKDDVNVKEDSAIALRLGLIGSKWDAHLNLSLQSKAESTDIIASTAPYNTAATITQESEGKIGIHVGGSYDIGTNNKLFGYVKTYGWEQKDSFASYPIADQLAGNYVAGGQTGTVEGDFTTIQLGWGKATTVNENGTIFTSAYVRHTKINLEFRNKTEVENLVIPLTVGYEAPATDWLTLRGSIVHNVWGTRDNKNFNSANPIARSLVVGTYGAQGKGTLPNTTEVNAGATLTFGNVNIDGLIGVTSPSRAGGVTSATGTPNKNQGVLAFDNLASKVGLTYKF